MGSARHQPPRLTRSRVAARHPKLAVARHPHRSHAVRELDAGAHRGGVQRRRHQRHRLVQQRDAGDAGAPRARRAATRARRCRSRLPALRPSSPRCPSSRVQAPTPPSAYSPIQLGTIVQFYYTFTDSGLNNLSSFGSSPHNCRRLGLTHSFSQFFHRPGPQRPAVARGARLHRWPAADRRCRNRQRKRGSGGPPPPRRQRRRCAPASPAAGASNVCAGGRGRHLCAADEGSSAAAQPCSACCSAGAHQSFRVADGVMAPRTLSVSDE